jgi:hypothetical protein
MRLSVLLAVTASTLLLASVANAQGSPFGNGTNSSSSSSSSSSNDDDVEDPDAPSAPPPKKRWGIGSSFETNRTLLQEDVGGRIKAFNTLSLYARYMITNADQVQATGGFIQRFIADETETGIRADDIGTSWSHRFQLPEKFTLAPSIGNSIPISYNSKLMGLIALPRASVFLSRSFFDDNLTLSLSGGAAYYIVKYRQPVGREGSNPRAQTNVRFSMNYSMPFHQALQVGGSVGTAYSWDYGTGRSEADPNLAQQFENREVQPSSDPYFDHPPAQQSYSGEVYISYNLPSLVGIQSNLQVALGQGDGTLRDGATHLYWLSRRGGQVSAALTVSY